MEQDGPSQEDGEWSTEIDPELLERARIDMARALILQNNRTSRRFDPLGRLRTAENEARVLAIGRKLVIVGLVLAALLVLLARRSAWLVVPFLVLHLCFRFLMPLRQRALEAVDGFLIGRARRLLAKLRTPSHTRLQLRGTALSVETRGPDGTVRTWTRDLRGCSYALVGEVSLMMFKNKRALRPGFVVFVRDPSERERLAKALEAQSQEVETLSPALLSGVVARRWP